MSNVYWNPTQGNYVNNGYSHRDNTWGYQSFNNTNSPQYYNRDWSNCNFEGLYVPQRGTYNLNNVHSIYNRAENGAPYPITNMNMTSVKRKKNRRRLYKRK